MRSELARGPGALEHALVAAVGRAHVLVDPGLTAAYETDWTRRFTGRSRAVVRPGDTGEVAAVLRACTAAGQPVVPQGGNTGLVGGSVPRGGEVLLSTRRLDHLEPVEPVGGTVVAGAGATLAALQAHATAAGLQVGTDFASRDSATVGGLVATNAGGLNVLRHGDVRAQLRGIEAVLADGTVVTRLSRLAKDTTGYDLPGLFAGSEGTLGVVTRVVWQLQPAPVHHVAALVGLPSVAVALAVLATVRAHVPDLLAAEAFGAAELALVREATGLPAPLSGEHAWYLLLECAGGRDPTAALGEALEAGGVEHAAVGTDARDRDRLRSYRERITESIATLGVPHKLDVALPLDALAGFLERLPSVVAARAPRARALVFGHLAEGNLHVNLVAGEDARPLDDGVDDAVLDLVVGLDGAVSAEHGLGVAKARWLARARTAGDVAAMRALKDAWDPRGLLNPGVLFPRP